MYAFWKRRVVVRRRYERRPAGARFDHQCVSPVPSEVYRGRKSRRTGADDEAVECQWNPLNPPDAAEQCGMHGACPDAPACRDVV